jgi:ABC-type phosphate transport system permease subunit
MIEVTAWWKLHSIRLAAAVSAFVGLLASQPEVLFAVIGIIPVDPLLRGVFAAAVALLTFAAPTLARLWPQPKLETTDDEG